MESSSLSYGGPGGAEKRPVDAAAPFGDADPAEPCWWLGKPVLAGATPEKLK